jgi:hypothetical protein
LTERAPPRQAVRPSGASTPPASPGGCTRDPYADSDAMDGMATAARSGRDDEGDHELGRWRCCCSRGEEHDHGAPPTERRLRVAVREAGSRARRAAAPVARLRAAVREASSAGETRSSSSVREVSSEEQQRRGGTWSSFSGGPGSLGIWRTTPRIADAAAGLSSAKSILRDHLPCPSAFGLRPLATILEILGKL